MSVNSDLVEYYVNLLIIQFNGKPKASGTMAAYINQMTFLELIREVENAYDVETSIGVQLDVLAKYVGADRTVTGVDFSRTFYGYVDYDEPTPYVNVAGVIDYDETNPPDAQTLEYDTDEGSLYDLNDSELRQLIKLKIAQNNSNHTTGEIDDIMEDFFGDGVIFDDNFNMTISYIFETSVQRFAEIAISQKALPKPAAVGLEVSFVDDIENIFGYQDYDSDAPAGFIQGYNDYSDDPFGSYLTY